MRRLTLVFLMSTILGGWALTASAAHMSIGIEGGGSFSNVTQDPTTTYDTRTGLSLGATFEAQLYEWLYLNPELLYVQAGLKTGTATVKRDYLTVPVNIMAKFNASPAFKPYVFTGPAIGFRMKAETDPGTGAAVTDDSANVKSTDLSLGFGGGFQWWVAPTIAVNLNARYLLGLSNDDNTTTTTSTKNKGFIAMAGIDFGF